MDELDIDDNVLRRPRTKISLISWWVFNVLHPLSVFVPSILIIAVCWSRGLTHLFTWHVLLTGVGFHLLMAAGVALPNGGNSLSRNSTHSTRKTIHWILQTVGGGCALIGTVLQYINRETKLKPHFVSTHSIVGVIALILVLLSLLNGVSALFGWKLRRFLSPSLTKLIHNATGVAAFAMGMCAIVLAYEYHIFKENFDLVVRVSLAIITVVTCVMSLFGVLKNIYNYLYETYLGCKSTEYILDDVE